MTASKTTKVNNGMHGHCNDSGRRASAWALTMLFCITCCLAVDSTAQGATVRDEFGAIAYSGNNGTASWTGDWIEVGESNGPSAGFLRVASTGPCTTGNCMRLGIDGDNDNKYPVREVNLSGAGSATFTNNYTTDQGDRGFVNVEVFANGGSSWTNLATCDIGSSGSGSETFDISAYLASDTQVRFRGTNRDDDPGSSAQFRGFMNFDNIQIEYFGLTGQTYWQVDSGTSVAGFTTDSTACGSQERDVYLITLMATGGFNCTNFRMEGRAAVPQNLWLMIKDTVYAVATDGTGIDFALNFEDDSSGGVTARHELGYAQGGVFTSFGFADEGPHTGQSTYVTDLSAISGTAPAGSHLALRMVDVAPSSGDMDDVRIYNRALSQPEILVLANCTQDLDIVKRAFWPDGTPIPTGATIPGGVEFKYLLYINNSGVARTDGTVRDVLEVAFPYQTGTIQVDNSVAKCALVACTVAEELTIIAAVVGGAPLSDAVDGDVGSYTGASLSVDAGNENVGNLQLDINADAVWALIVLGENAVNRTHFMNTMIEE